MYCAVTFLNEKEELSSRSERHRRSRGTALPAIRPGRGRRPLMTRNTFARLVLLFAVLVLGAPIVGAQGTGGRISGTVVDSSGAVLPGATVTIVQDQTKLTRSATTDKDGAFLFVSLPVGTYTVSAELFGFRKEVESGFTLVSDGRVTADFALP